MSSDKAITDRVRCGQYELQVVMSSSPPADENVQRVILVVHGRGKQNLSQDLFSLLTYLLSERNADEMFSQASSANPDSSSSLIVAPQFVSLARRRKETSLSYAVQSSTTAWTRKNTTGILVGQTSSWFGKAIMYVS
jgi:hypothetical protein